MKNDSKTVKQSQGALTRDPDDRDPFKRKQQIVISSGVEDKSRKTLKADVPEGIVTFLDLKAGNKLQWKMDVIDGERYVILNKLERRIKEEISKSE